MDLLSREVAENPAPFHYAELPLSRVRWFSYRTPYSLKAVASSPEVPHRGSLLRFCGTDSNALESAYR